MHITYRRAVVAVAFLAGIGFALRPMWAVPNGAHFSAPHQNGVRSFVSRIELNSRAPELVKRILYAVAPTTVYACGTPPCDGTSTAPTGYCYNSGGYQCTAYGCPNVGGQTLCSSWMANSCIIPGGGTYPCSNSKNVSCE